MIYRKFLKLRFRNNLRRSYRYFKYKHIIMKDKISIKKF